MELTEKRLPVYKAIINSDENFGVDFVALVDEPAIERNWMAFNDKKNLFQVTDNPKRIVMGALMVANLPIYRRDEQRGEYFITFDKPTIEEIVLRFHKKKYSDSVNVMHNGQKIEGVYMFESMIIDSTRGIETPKGFDKLPDGSWFGSYKVENDSIWNKIMKGEFMGFSIEGYFEDSLTYELTDQQLLNVIRAINKSN